MTQVVDRQEAINQRVINDAKVIRLAHNKTKQTVSGIETPNYMNDPRLQALTQWAAEQLQQPVEALSVVSGDASFRRYFRRSCTLENQYAPLKGQSSTSVVAVDSPPDKEPIDAFVMVSELLASAGLSVPRVLHADHQQGFMLLSDMGDALYLPALNDKSADKLYHAAMDALIDLQLGCLNRQSELPPYDKAQLHREMELFREWFLQQHLQMTLEPADHQLLDQWFDCLSESALSQPQVAVHRDYHSRNLMILPQHSPGIIDYQDAVEGAVSYDLVSLLKDCYIRWPRHRQLQWLEYYRSQLQQKSSHSKDKSLSAELTKAVNARNFVQDFDWMGMQRHIKVAGIFCRLYHRDGKAGYLADIPLTLGYIVEALKQYPELKQYLNWFEERLKPNLERHNMMWTSFE